MRESSGVQAMPRRPTNGPRLINGAARLPCWKSASRISPFAVPGDRPIASWRPSHENANASTAPIDTLHAARARFAAARRETHRLQPARRRRREVGDLVRRSATRPGSGRSLPGPGSACRPRAGRSRGPAGGSRLRPRRAGGGRPPTSSRRSRSLDRDERSRRPAARRHEPQAAAPPARRDEGYAAPVGRDRRQRIALRVRGERPRIAPVGLAHPDVARAVARGHEREPAVPRDGGRRVLGARGGELGARVPRRLAQVELAQRAAAGPRLANEAPAVSRHSRREVVAGAAGEPALAARRRAAATRG